MQSIVSLDVSSTTTGWVTLSDTTIVAYGKINLDYKKLDKIEKMFIFRTELKELLLKFKPDHIVIEDVFFGKNAKVMKTLANFGGIAKESSLRYANILPYIMDNKTTKAYFKVSSKKELFEKLCYKLDLNNSDYKLYNDVLDAYAQGICYYNTVLNEVDE